MPVPPPIITPATGRSRNAWTTSTSSHPITETQPVAPNGRPDESNRERPVRCKLPAKVFVDYGRKRGRVDAVLHDDHGLPDVAKQFEMSGSAHDDRVRYPQAEPLQHAGQPQADPAALPDRFRKLEDRVTGVDDHPVAARETAHSCRKNSGVSHVHDIDDVRPESESILQEADD
ncbi:MAG: hypothetical protein IPF82_05035 [Blastocatellia bacterium]|nr:hypothetical protein [Blastocatellia bacterium]